MPLIIQADPDFNDGPGEMPMVFMTIIYGAMGLGGFIPGLLHLVAGIRNLRYKGRTLGIVALGFGLAATMTCYCAPTSIALTVYGLIVYLNPAVAQVFAAQDQRQHLHSQDVTY